jgi:hypothetical protein
MCKIKDTIEDKLNFINEELDYLYHSGRNDASKDICNSCGALCEELYCDKCQYEIENIDGYWN